MNEVADRPSNTSESAAIRTCRSGKTDFFPRTTGKFAAAQAPGSPFDIYRVQPKLLTRFRAARARKADDIHRLTRCSFTSASNFTRLKAARHKVRPAAAVKCLSS